MSRMDEVNLGDGVVVAVVEPSSEVEVRTAGTRSVAASCGPELHAVRSNDAASTDVEPARAVFLAAHSRVTRLPVLSRHRGPLSPRSSARGRTLFALGTPESPIGRRCETGRVGNKCVKPLKSGGA